jgi:hypothetical protein
MNRIKLGIIFTICFQFGINAEDMVSVEVKCHYFNIQNSCSYIWLTICNNSPDSIFFITDYEIDEVSKNENGLIVSLISYNLSLFKRYEEEKIISSNLFITPKNQMIARFQCVNILVRIYDFEAILPKSNFNISSLKNFSYASINPQVIYQCAGGSIDERKNFISSNFYFIEWNRKGDANL